MAESCTCHVRPDMAIPFLPMLGLGVFQLPQKWTTLPPLSFLSAVPVSGWHTSSYRKSPPHAFNWVSLSGEKIQKHPEPMHALARCSSLSIFIVCFFGIGASPEQTRPSWPRAAEGLHDSGGETSIQVLVWLPLAALYTWCEPQTNFP